MVVGLVSFSSLAALPLHIVDSRQVGVWSALSCCECPKPVRLGAHSLNAALCWIWQVPMSNAATWNDELSPRMVGDQKLAGPNLFVTWAVILVITAGLSAWVYFYSKATL